MRWMRWVPFYSMLALQRYLIWAVVQQPTAQTKFGHREMLAHWYFSYRYLAAVRMGDTVLLDE